MEQPDNPASFNPAAKLEGVSHRQTKRSWWAIVLSGLAAGLSMSLSLIVQGEFHALVSDEAARGFFPRLAIPWAFLSWCSDDSSSLPKTR